MRKNILCFGDSNTHGFNSRTFGRYDENTRWPMLLQKELGDEYNIIEEGLSGRTTVFRDPLTEGLAGIDYIYPCLCSHEPVSLIVIMLGTNDTKERFSCSAEAIALGLRRLIKKIQSSDEQFLNSKVEILVVTPKSIEKAYENTDFVFTMGRGCSEKSAGLSKSFKEIADLTGCHYLDANEIVDDYSSNYNGDYVHLDELRHKQLAEGIAEKIRSLHI